MSKYTQASGRCNPGSSSVSGTPLLPSCGGCRRARDPLRKPYCHNVRHRARIDAERAVLGPLPVQRTADFELGRVQVSVHSGFALRKVFYSVPSRLIGHTLRVHLYDDRLELFVGSSPLLTLRRGRAHSDGRRGHVVNYHHLIHALRRGSVPAQRRTDARSVVEEADEVALAPPFAVGDYTASLSRRCPQALISARQPANRCGNMPFTSLTTCCTRRTRRRTQRIAPGSSTASRRN